MKTEVFECLSSLHIMSLIGIEFGDWMMHCGHFQSEVSPALAPVLTIDGDVAGHLRLDVAVRVVVLAELPACGFDGHDVRVLRLEDLQVVLKNLKRREKNGNISQLKLQTILRISTAGY